MNPNNIQITFTKKAVPIPADYRPLYKIAQILQIILFCGRGGKISLLKLQFFIWASKSERNRNEFYKLISGKNDSKIWSLDPTVIRAINFAIGERLCERVNDKIKITHKGETFVKQLGEKNILENQKSFLMNIGKSVSEKEVKTIAKEWAI